MINFAAILDDWYNTEKKCVKCGRTKQKYGDKTCYGCGHEIPEDAMTVTYSSKPVDNKHRVTKCA